MNNEQRGTILLREKKKKNQESDAKSLEGETQEDETEQEHIEESKE